MNVSGLELQWRRKLSFDKFLPPFLGGPIDEIYEQAMAKKKHRLILGPYAPVPKVFECMGIKDFESLDNRLWQIDESYPLARALLIKDNSIDLDRFWVCIEKVPKQHFKAILRIFTELGSVLESLLLYDNNLFYVQYREEIAKDKALHYNNHLMCINNQVISVKTSLRSYDEILAVKRHLRLSRENSIKSKEGSYNRNMRDSTKFTSIMKIFTGDDCITAILTLGCLFFIIYLIRTFGFKN